VAKDQSKKASSKAKNTRQEPSPPPRGAARRVAQAAVHEDRLDALSVLLERTSSPNEIANALRVPLSTISYHIKDLQKKGAVELVKTEPRRGAIEHFYRAVLTPEISDAEWQKMPKASRRELAETALTAIVAEALSSLDHGCMDDDDDLYVLWVAAQLTPEGRREAYELQAEFHDRIEAIKARDQERQADDEDLPVRLVAMLGFDRAGPGRPEGYALRRDHRKQP
jgi:DNA-binding MarR family transcriptional regulator